MTTLSLIEPDVLSWDAFVASHSHGHLLQTQGWAALKSGVGWQNRRIAVARGSRLVAGAQLLIRPRFGLAVAYVPRGPLLSGEPAIDQTLFAGIERHARRARAVFLRVEPNLLSGHPLANYLTNLLAPRRYQPQPPLQPRSTIHLDLTPTPEQLLAAMSKGHRADIKRATRDGIVVRTGDHPGDLERFYAVMQATSQRAQFGIHHASYYQNMLQQFGNQARLWIAERDSQVHAVAISAYWAGQALYLYSGSTDEGLRSGAQHAIQWQTMQWARERACQIYDFWGIPDAFGEAAMINDPVERAQREEAAKNSPIYGVYRFKKGFGGNVVRYLPAFDRVYLAPLYHFWRRRTA